MSNPYLAEAAAWAWSLGHGCAPSETEFATIGELYAAMDRAADKDNAESPTSLGWAKPWPVVETHKDGRMKVLQHITGSGRLTIRVREDGLSIRLTSPSYRESKYPYCSATLVASDRPAYLVHWKARAEFATESRLEHLRGLRLTGPQSETILRWILTNAREKNKKLEATAREALTDRYYFCRERNWSADEMDNEEKVERSRTHYLSILQRYDLPQARIALVQAAELAGCPHGLLGWFSLRWDGPRLHVEENGLEQKAAA